MGCGPEIADGAIESAGWPVALFTQRHQDQVAPSGQQFGKLDCYATRCILTVYADMCQVVDAYVQRLVSVTERMASAGPECLMRWTAPNNSGIWKT